MKKAALLFLTLALGANLLTASVPSESAMQKLRSEIIKMLDDPRIPLDEEVTLAKINFTLTKGGEIVVLSVKTENGFVDSYVKNRLNYKKVSCPVQSTGKIFRMNLKILRGF